MLKLKKTTTINDINFKYNPHNYSNEFYKIKSTHAKSKGKILIQFQLYNKESF
jgi:hypothetical protein